MHIHIRRDNQKAKFWIKPLRIADNEGFAEHELNQIKAIIEENRTAIEEAWNEKQ